MAAEMIAINSGLGYLIIDSNAGNRYDLVLAGMVIIGVIGFLLIAACNAFNNSEWYNGAMDAKISATSGRRTRLGRAPLCARRIEFTVADGEFVALVGPLGGKTTLLHILAGLNGQTGRGNCRCQLKDRAEPQRHCDLAAGIGLPWLTVQQNLMFGLNGLPARASPPRRPLYGYGRVAGLERAFPFQLSGGCETAGGGGQSLIVKPDLLYMDEPSRGARCPHALADAA